MTTEGREYESIPTSTLRFLADLSKVIASSSITSAECERELKKLRAELANRPTEEKAVPNRSPLLPLLPHLAFDL